MKQLLNILTVAALLNALRAWAATEALVSYEMPVLGSFNGTVGWTFQPQVDLSVKSLGAFSYLVNNQGPISVGLWNSAGSLLASASVSINSVLTNQSRYEPITAVPLTIGQTYYLGAFAPSGTISGDVISAADGGSAITVPEIQLNLVAAATNSIFEFPSLTQGAPGSGFMGPNFEFSVVPEPTTLWLALIGATVVAPQLWRRRR